ncbi:MAG: hypothetical protein ACRD4O_15575 [Bryobacteraceae bacterium]
MSSRFTRREFAAIAGAAPLAAQAISKIPPQGAPAPPQPPATPEQRFQQALADVRKTSSRLSQVELPMDLEPAFSFRATRG